jgi:hypothetical protein
VTLCPGSSGHSEDGEGPLGVPGGAAEDGGDVGVAVLTMDADGEVAQACHDAGQVPGADLRAVLTEGAVADVVELVFDLPAAADPCSRFRAGGRAGRQAGDQVDLLDRQLARDVIRLPNVIVYFGVMGMNSGRQRERWA